MYVRVREQAACSVGRGCVRRERERERKREREEGRVAQRAAAAMATATATGDSEAGRQQEREKKSRLPHDASPRWFGRGWENWLCEWICSKPARAGSVWLANARLAGHDGMHVTRAVRPGRATPPLPFVRLIVVVVVVMMRIIMATTV